MMKRLDVCYSSMIFFTIHITSTALLYKLTFSNILLHKSAKPISLTNQVYLQFHLNKEKKGMCLTRRKICTISFHTAQLSHESPLAELQIFI